MASRFAFVFVAALAAFLAVTWETNATIIRRDAPTSEKPSDLEQAFNNIKHGFEEFAQKVQNNELVQNVSKAFNDLGEKIKERGQEIIDRINSEQTTPKN